MLKRSMVILMVVILLFSFSTLAFAEDTTNNENSKVDVSIEEGEGEILFLQAVPDHAEDNPSPGQHPDNPIRVAGN